MTDPERSPVRGLFEAHVPVGDLRRSIDFYRDVVGLEVAHEEPKRNAAFLWVGGRGRSMLGLWETGSAPMSLKLHLAFEIELDDLLQASERLRALGVTPLSYFGEESAEPSVLGWMPAAAIYLEDPDGHLLEYLTMLDEEPRPDEFLVPYSQWLATAPEP